MGEPTIRGCVSRTTITSEDLESLAPTRPAAGARAAAFLEQLERGGVARATARRQRAAAAAHASARHALESVAEHVAPEVAAEAASHLGMAGTAVAAELLGAALLPAAMVRTLGEGLEQIALAHRRAQAWGRSAQLARGYARMTAAALDGSGRSLARARQRARRYAPSVRPAALYVQRHGRFEKVTLDKPHHARQRRELRRAFLDGVALAERALARLSRGERRELRAKLARVSSGATTYQRIHQLTRAAAGVDRLWAAGAPR